MYAYLKFTITFLIGLNAMNLAAMEINFEDQQEVESWKIVNDGVMGGLSSSSVEIIDDSLVFTGRVSLENNGGFASVRRVGSKSPKSTKKIRIRIKADGKTYKFRLRTSQTWDSIAYSVSFSTKKAAWVEKTFKPQDFIPTWRGRVVKDAPALKFSDLNQIGILIADKQEGEFKLELSEIEFIED